MKMPQPKTKDANDTNGMGERRQTSMNWTAKNFRTYLHDPTCCEGFTQSVCVLYPGSQW